MIAGKIKPIIWMLGCAWPIFSSNVQAEPIVIPVDAYGNVDKIRQLSQQGKIIPMRRLLKKAMPYVHGRIIEAGLELEHGQLLYEIEYVDSKGKVHEVYFNADDGMLFSPSKTKDNQSTDEKGDKEGRELN